MLRGKQQLKAKAEEQANNRTVANPEDENRNRNRTSIWNLLDSIEVKVVAELAYIYWSQACVKFFIDTTNTTPFPRLRVKEGGCVGRRGCIKGKKLDVCVHGVERVLKGSGMFGTEAWMTWLKRERVRWHPDKFVGRGEVQDMAAEMFQLVQAVVRC